MSLKPNGLYNFIFTALRGALHISQVISLCTNIASQVSQIALFGCLVSNVSTLTYNKRFVSLLSTFSHLWNNHTRTSVKRDKHS